MVAQEYERRRRRRRRRDTTRAWTRINAVYPLLSDNYRDLLKTARERMPIILSMRASFFERAYLLLDEDDLGAWHQRCVAGIVAWRDAEFAGYPARLARVATGDGGSVGWVSE